MVDMETLMKVAEHSFAMPFARLVFPVPGGPYSSTPLPSEHGQLSPFKWKQVSRQMHPPPHAQSGGTMQAVLRCTSEAGTEAYARRPPGAGMARSSTSATDL